MTIAAASSGDPDAPHAGDALRTTIGVPAEAERGSIVITESTDTALGAVRDAMRRVEVLRIRRNAILDQQSTGYRRRSANLPQLGDRARSVASEMAALRSSRST